MSRSLWLFCLVVFLGACDSGAPPPAKDETIFDGQLKALDEAKAVEQKMQEVEKRRKALLEGQGG